MKLYKTSVIIELLVDNWECNNRYVGFDMDADGIVTMTFKEHAPGWKDERTGLGESTEAVTVWENEGEYQPD